MGCPLTVQNVFLLLFSIVNNILQKIVIGNIDFLAFKYIAEKNFVGFVDTVCVGNRQNRERNSDV